MVSRTLAFVFRLATQWSPEHLNLFLGWPPSEHLHLYLSALSTLLYSPVHQGVLEEKTTSTYIQQLHLTVQGETRRGATECEGGVTEMRGNATVL